MILKINSIDHSGSIVDGPGVRTVLFVQGCKRGCDGCHNPKTWDANKGKEVIIEEIIEELENKCRNKNLTISGGEPLLQYPAILDLVKKLHDFNITLYTGFEIKDVPEEILNHINYIKVGNYIKEQRTTINPYIGSKNQRFINLECKNNEIN